MIHKVEWAKTLTTRDVQKLDCLYQFAQQIFNEAPSWHTIDFDCDQKDCAKEHKTVLNNGWYIHQVPWKTANKEKSGTCFQIFPSPRQYLQQLHVNGTPQRFTILAHDQESLLGVQLHFDHEEFVKTRYLELSKRRNGYTTKGETAVLKSRDIEFLFLALPSWAVKNTHTLPVA